uniref:S1 motif domain-containing protein n=1 Tax=Fagus sylvatica TaxID=28930 RepID=A0A2N9IMU4_FAGSY
MGLWARIAGKLGRVCREGREHSIDALETERCHFFFNPVTLTISLSLSHPPKTHLQNPPKFTHFPLLALSYFLRVVELLGIYELFSSTHLPLNPPSPTLTTKATKDDEELELLNKPSPLPIDNYLDTESEKPDKDEALAPFLKFFKGRDSEEEVEEEHLSDLEVKTDVNGSNEEAKKVGVEYYEPKPGDFVVGVVVSGNENKLDVNVGADFLGTMLTKEVLPLYDKEMEYLLCDTNTDTDTNKDKDSAKFMVNGKMGIVKNDEALSGGPLPGRPVVETGTILFAEVLGRTLSGRPLLSTRRLFRRLAWHRVRQIKQLNEPIEVKITEWNTGGLLTRIEGLRAFLPKAELMNRVNNFAELKENVSSL